MNATLGQIITNPNNTEQNWTVGSRGKRSKWILDMIESGELVLPIKDVEEVKIKTLVDFTPEQIEAYRNGEVKGRKPACIQEAFENGTLTYNKSEEEVTEDNEPRFEDFSTEEIELYKNRRGRKPKWFTQAVEDGRITLVEKVITKTQANAAVNTESNKNDVKSLKTWIYTGLRDENDKTCPVNVQCKVIAYSPVEAITLLNKTMKNPVSMKELMSCWRIIADEFQTHVGAFEFDKSANIWVERKPIKV